ncbi:MAG: hypothetical protein HZB15_05250 [Actinobacteria bacterium]|nr:hypothetical protein [Actinomycetota bacterium]
MHSSRLVRVAALAALAGTVLLPLTASAASLNLIEYASTWRVLDDGTNQTPAALPATNHFASPAYVENVSWRSETIQPNKVLGYGDNTRANFPTQEPNLHFSPTNALPNTNKYITTYFRRSFDVTSASSVSSLVLNLRRDDGVVVYLNGVEVARSNMDPGTVTYTTFAPTIVDGAAEYTPVAVNIPTTGLVNGQNVLAIELHQRDGTSSDISFAAQLVATTLDPEIPEAPMTVLLPLVAAAGFGGLTFVQRRRTARA